MEHWQRGGKSKFSGTQEQKCSTNNLQSWQRETGKFSAGNVWHTLKKDVVEEKFKVCLVDWQKANKYDDSSPKDTYTLVIGHEVNLFDKVFKDHVDHLQQEGEIGHSFFYVTKNDKVYTALSFGPLNHQIPVMPGTPDFPVKEAFRFHRFYLTKEQANSIKKQNNIFRGKVEAPTTIKRERKSNDFLGVSATRLNNPDKVYYDLTSNITCAYSAQHVLSLSGIQTPSGKGPIDTPGFFSSNLFVDSFRNIRVGLMLNVNPRQSTEDVKTPFEAVNPYQWYYDLSQKYGEGELYQGLNPVKDIESDGFTFHEPLKIIEGEPDPLIKTGQAGHVHHLR